MRRRTVGVAAASVVVLGGAVLAGVLGGVLPGDGLTGEGAAAGAVAPTPAFPVGASDDGASLVDAAGEPFGYLADTVWLAPSRLDVAGVRDLLDARVAQGFTAVQVSALAFPHLPGDVANAYGDVPVRGMDLSRPVEVGARTDDPASPDYDYWDHLDALVDMAAERGLLVTVVPAWYGYGGEDWRGYVDVDAARAYGEFLGQRLGHHPNLMWLLGGDDDPVGDAGRVPDGGRTGEVVAATRAMARAIAGSEAVPHLMTYHAARGVSSLEHFADDAWHTVVSAYSDELTWRDVADARRAGMPVVLTEAYYDGREDGTVLDRQGLRAEAWWAVLGGAGFAYGHEDVWDLDPGHGPDSDAGAASWREALTAPSATDVGVLARTVHDLLPLRPAGEGVLVSGRGDGDGRAAAALSADGRTALVYVPERRTVEVDLTSVGDGGPVTVAWLDPADGSEQPVDPPAGDRASVRPPDGLEDAVLVVRAA